MCRWRGIVFIAVIRKGLSRVILEQSPQRLWHEEGANLRRKLPGWKNSKYEDSEEEFVMEKQESSMVKEEEEGKELKKTSLKM